MTRYFPEEIADLRD